MSNKFKIALVATSLATAIVVAGPEVDVDGFEVEIVQNQAVAEIVSGVVANAKPVEPYLVIAGLNGRSDGGRDGGRGGRGEDHKNSGNRDGGY